MTCKRYALIVEYIGKQYYGSQKQPSRQTIQSELEKAISTLIKQEIKTIFSGRTDKGVNSKGQVVHIDVNKSIVASRFLHSVNELLPSDISVSDIFEVPNDFHSQKSAKKRHYQYQLINRKNRSAFDGDLLLVKDELSIERMQKALSYIQGEHDFSSFRSAGSTTPSSVCFIYKSECKKLGDKVLIDIVGNRFLYNMVRAIVGTLLLIEKYDLGPEFIKEVLDSKDRTKAGKTVSPYGLTLMKVEY